MELYLFALNR